MAFQKVQAQVAKTMDDLKTANLLKLLQIGDTLKAKLSSDFAAVHGVSVNEFFMLEEED